MPGPLSDTGTGLVVQQVELFALSAETNGKALYFDGDGDYIAFDSPAENLPIGDSPYTLEAWIKPEVAAVRSAAMEDSEAGGRSCFHVHVYVCTREPCACVR